MISKRIILIIVLLAALFLFSSCLLPNKTTHLPVDLENSFDALDNTLSPEDIDTIKNMPEDNISSLHMGLGMWIRNNWGLWKKEGPLVKYFNDLGIFHPDDMSGIILTSYWRHLHNQPIELEQQIRYYQQYWEDLKVDTINR